MPYKFFFIFLIASGAFSCISNQIHSSRNLYNDSVYQQLWSAEWNKDGKYIAVGGVDSTVRIYHGASLKLYKSFYVPNWIHVVKWNPQRDILAIATLTEYVQLLDVNTGEFIQLDNRTGPNTFPNDNGSRAIGWNHTGDMLAVAGLDGIIKIWNSRGNLLKYIKKEYNPPSDHIAYLALDWHPFKNSFIAANFEIQLYDSLFKEIRTFRHTNKEAIILSASWHPSGDFFAIGDYGHNWEGENVPSLLHFWSVDGRYLKRIHGSKAEYRNIDWNKNGDRLASASDKLRIWSREGELLYESPADSSNYLWGIDWHPNGTKIVTSSRHKSVAIWNEKAKLLKRIEVEKQ